MDIRLTEKLTLPSLAPSSSYYPSPARVLALYNGHPFIVIEQYFYTRHLFFTRQVTARPNDRIHAMGMPRCYLRFLIAGWDARWRES